MGMPSMAMDAPVPVSKRRAFSAFLSGLRIANGCAVITLSTNKRSIMLMAHNTCITRKSAIPILAGAFQLVSQTWAGIAQLLILL